MEKRFNFIAKWTKRLTWELKHQLLLPVWIIGLKPESIDIRVVIKSNIMVMVMVMVMVMAMVMVMVINVTWKYWQGWQQCQAPLSPWSATHHGGTPRCQRTKRVTPEHDDNMMILEVGGPSESETLILEGGKSYPVRWLKCWPAIWGCFDSRLSFLKYDFCQIFL